MALPSELRTPRMEALERQLEPFDEAKFRWLKPLNEEDNRLIGSYIQIYNYLDFNLRAPSKSSMQPERCPNRMEINTRTFAMQSLFQQQSAP